MTIATNVTAKITDSLTGQAQQAMSAIVRKIREKLRSRAGAADQIAALDAATSEAATAEALAQILERLFTMDPRFREEIQGLWDSVHAADCGNNAFYGKANKVIMMRDVIGDLTIN